MISVIIPMFNDAQHISRAIKSVLDQTFREFEVIIVDDGSTDGSGEVARSFRDSRCCVIRRENEGASAARNAGIDAARFPFVALLDADDSWRTHHLRDIAHLIHKYPDAAVYATAYTTIEPSGTERMARLAPNGHDLLSDFVVPDYFRWAARSDPPVTSSSVAFRRSAFQVTGGFPVGVSTGEDLVTWARLLVSNKLAYTLVPSARYFVPDVLSAQRRMQLRAPSEPDYVERALLELQGCHPAIARSIELYLAQWYRMRGMVFLELGQSAKCIGEVVKAVRLDRVRRRDIVVLIAAGCPDLVAMAIVRFARRARAYMEQARLHQTRSPAED